MLTAEEIRAKIFKQAEKFNEFYAAGKWAQAKYAHYAAFATSEMVELDETDLIRLFGSRAYTDTYPATVGLFDEEKVKYVYWKVIKGHERERRPYIC